MYTTILTKAKLRAKHLKHLPERLLALVKDAEYPQARIHSIKARTKVVCIMHCGNGMFFQALTNISEHPYIRKKLLQEYMEDVNSIPIHKIPDMAEYKRILIDVLSWKPENLF